MIKKLVLSATVLLVATAVSALEVKNPNAVVPDAQKILVETRQVEVVEEGTIARWKAEIESNNNIITGILSQKTGLEIRNAVLKAKIGSAIGLGLDPNMVSLPIPKPKEVEEVKRLEP